MTAAFLEKNHGSESEEGSALRGSLPSETKSLLLHGVIKENCSKAKPLPVSEEQLLSAEHLLPLCFRGGPQQEGLSSLSGTVTQTLLWCEGWWA